MTRRLQWFLVLLGLWLPAGVHADVDFESLLKVDVEATVLDVAAHPGEDLIFLLTPGAVLIYSSKDRTMLDRIPLQESFDRIAVLDDERLILTGNTPSRINILRFNRIFAIDVAGRAAKGPADAKVTLVVFDDYQCPYCARLERFIHQVLEQFPNDVKYVIKHFPLSNHQFAHPGAMAALAAGKQGKFWEFHQRLLENHDQLNEEKILEIAGELELNREQFDQDRQSPASRQLIQEDIANGRSIGVSGTPTAFINGKRINNRDLGKLPELIIRELDR